jgi:hypothetical protein
MNIALKFPSTFLAFGAMLSLGSSSQAAALFVFDAVNNVHSTPFGTESYGWSTGLGTPFVVDSTASTGLGMSIWGPAAFPSVSSNPGVYYNASGVSTSGAGVVVPPGGISLHPGQAGQYAIIRVTQSPLSPSQTISLTGLFWGQNTFGTTTDVHVLQNGAAIFNGNVNGFGTPSNVPFSLTVTVNPGDNLDFAVGFGNGNHNADSTGLTANWTVVPEPSGVLFLGLTGAAALRRRRKQPSA